MKILDCTLRDGGYYTNWDFDKAFLESYLNAVNSLPIDFVEIGYRSNERGKYLGEFFYCPEYLLKMLSDQCEKPLALMLNEKEVSLNNIHSLLSQCETVDLIRLAVAPENFERSIHIGKLIKSKGFKVAINLMYMSKWDEIDEMKGTLASIRLNEIDYVNMVDSYGGMTPERVGIIAREFMKASDVPLGFHGHNNLELALANSIVAMREGVAIIDSTFTGMGRGAGNLKTELLLTYLNANESLDLDFNVLSATVESVSELQSRYNWGTNLPYMVAGANSIPQQEIMDWINIRFYSYNSVLKALENRKINQSDDLRFPQFTASMNQNSHGTLIIGGGPSALMHANAIKVWLSEHMNVNVVFASTKYIHHYTDVKNKAYVCIVGNEGKRLEDNLTNANDLEFSCILPPFPREMGTYVPDGLRKLTYELDNTPFSDFQASHTSLALSLALKLNSKNLFTAGYDGYGANVMNRKEKVLFQENETLFEAYSVFSGKSITSITSTDYSKLKKESVFRLLRK